MKEYELEILHILRAQISIQFKTTQIKYECSSQYLCFYEQTCLAASAGLLAAAAATAAAAAVMLLPLVVLLSLLLLFIRWCML